MPSPTNRKQTPSLAGRDGAGRTTFEATMRLAVELGVVADMILIGETTDPISYLAAFDVFLNTSIYEGLSISMMEALERVQRLTGRKLDWRYVEEARKGDHICYISNLRKFQTHYPKWKITRSLDAILEEVIAAQRAKQVHSAAR